VSDLDEAPPQVDGALHDLELDSVFTQSWVVAGPLDRLANAGDHLVCRVAHVPILLTRARDGALHGFVNVCRHRAYPVATEDGCRQLLQCAYHAWTYELDGRLNRAPRAEAEPGFDKADFSLVRVAVDTWGPLVWVNPDPAAAPLRETHPELDSLASEHGIDLADLTFQSRSSSVVSEEWKRCIEDTSERYHAPDGPSGFAGGDGVLARFDAAGNGGRRSLLVWPASLVVVDDEVVIVDTITPDVPGTCRRQTQVFARDGVSAIDAAPRAAALADPAGGATTLPDERDVARFQRLAWERFRAAPRR
jgi:phenylpropionate dioxygenase-like ring-hydroxylating dioxygenase large terminal subunit